jgi:hypothetical protein
MTEKQGPTDRRPFGVMDILVGESAPCIPKAEPEVVSAKLKRLQEKPEGDTDGE